MGKCFSDSVDFIDMARVHSHTRDLWATIDCIISAVVQLQRELSTAIPRYDSVDWLSREIKERLDKTHNERAERWKKDHHQLTAPVCPDCRSLMRKVEFYSNDPMVVVWRCKCKAQKSDEKLYRHRENTEREEWPA